MGHNPSRRRPTTATSDKKQLDRIERRQVAMLRHLHSALVLLIQVLQQTPPPDSSDAETAAKVDELTAQVEAMTADQAEAQAGAPDPDE